MIPKTAVNADWLSTRRWGGENAHVRELDEDMWSFTTDIAFGEVWSRKGLSLREREMVTLGLLLAAGAEGIGTHMRNAHRLGITYGEMKEVILHSILYLGMPKGFFGFKKLKEVMTAQPNDPAAKK